jgi:hypothetical protein
MRRLPLLRSGLILLGLFVLLAVLGAAPRNRPAEAQSTQPTLTITDQIPASAGATVQVPISLDTGGAAVATVAMVIDYDEQWLTLDPTDANNDDIPDAVAFSLPSGFSGLVPAVDSTAGTVSIFAGDLATPLDALDSSTLVTLTFGVGSPTTASSATVGFGSEPPVSFGSTTGDSISGATDGGTVQITPSAPPGNPSLSIANYSATGGESVQVPVNFQAAGEEVAAVAFVLDYDEQWLTFDPTDANNDDIPDAVVFSLPSGFSGLVPAVDSTAGTLSIFVGDLNPPLDALSDGTLLSVTFDVDHTSSSGSAAIGFASSPPISFGSPQGSSITGTSDGGTVQIAPSDDPSPPSSDVFLPLIIR